MGAFSSVDLTGHPTASPETRQGLRPLSFAVIEARAEGREKMFCAKCGSKIADGQNVCPSCGMSMDGKLISDTTVPDARSQATVVVVKEKSGCLKGCAVIVGLIVAIGIAGAIVSAYSSYKEKKAEQIAIAKSAAVPIEDAARNGDALIALIKTKNNKRQTLAYETAFNKMKGKTVVMRGKVRVIDRQAFSDKVYVSLTVGQINALERLNIQFNISESQITKVKEWNKDEIHTLRGIISGQGDDILDDAVCDGAQVVEGDTLEQFEALKLKQEQIATAARLKAEQEAAAAKLKAKQEAAAARLKAEQEAAAASSAVPVKEAIKNGEALMEWVKNKSKQTELARDTTFEKLKGKTVILRGKVRQVGRTALSDEVYVSLTVGQIDALERLNIQFNIRQSHVEEINSWNKGEEHTLRGRIKGKGDLSDDAECDLGEIVKGAELERTGTTVTTDNDVSDIPATVEKNIKASIKSWQQKRWKSDVIKGARREKGKVEIADLTEECKTKELQPVLDMLIADYVMMVNCIDAYADSDNEVEALARFSSALSLSDIAKILEDSAKLVQTLDNLRKGTSAFDAARLTKLAADAITIGKVTLSIGDVCGLSKNLLSQKP